MDFNRRRALLGGVAGAGLLLPYRADADSLFTNFAFRASNTPTPRTMPVRLAEIKNVKDFGAIGDGSTNDTAAIQATIDWTSGADRGTIYFPAGSYLVNAPLTFNYSGALNICFRGDGEASIISGTVSSGYIFDRKLMSPSNQATVIFEKLVISNGSSSSNTGAIRIGSTISGAIRDVRFGGYNGITTEDSAGVSSQNIFMEDLRCGGTAAGGSAVIMGGSGAIVGSDIRGCDTAYRMYGNGWLITGGRVERCNTGYLLGVDSAGTDQGASGFTINAGTTEGLKINMDFAGTCSGFYIGQMGFLNHFPPNSGQDGMQDPENGLWIRADKASNGVISGMAFGGDGCTIAQCQIDASTTRANIVVIGCTATVFAGGGATYVFPSNAFTAQYLNCATGAGSPASGQPIWTYSQLPTGGNVQEGDEFNISDPNSATWGANVTASGSSGHVIVRWNGSNWTVVGK